MTLRAAKLPEFDLYTHEKLNKILSQQKAQKEESAKSHEVLVSEMLSMKRMMASVLANQALLMNHLLNSTNPAGNSVPPVPPLNQHQNQNNQSLEFNRPHINVAAPEVEVVRQENDVDFIGYVPAISGGGMQTVSPTMSPEHQLQKGKKRDRSLGDGRRIPGQQAKRKKSETNGLFKELGRGQQMQAAPSGLEGYGKMKLYEFITVVATKRLQGIINPSDSNPLRLATKEAATMTAKLWRMLNFLTDNCKTEEEFQIWTGKYNVLPANADRAAREALDARIASVAKALSRRAEEWLDSIGCKKKREICGTLRSRIETYKVHLNKEKAECKWDRDKIVQIRTRKRMSATEAAAAAKAAAAESEVQEEGVE